jgi:hypothetical protein
MHGDGEQRLFLLLHLVDPLPRHEPPAEAPEPLRAGDPYDAEVWYTDQQVGRVMAKLKELGLYDKSAIIVTGEPGGANGAGGAAGSDLSGPRTRVPIIARVPGVAPRRVRAAVGHVDLAPTLLHLARAEPAGTFLGRSLLDVMTGAREDDLASDHVLQEAAFALNAGRADHRARRRAIATATHHLVWQREPNAEAVACYDVLDDPAERQDLWATRYGEEVCAGLRLELRRHVALLPFAQLAPRFTIDLTASVSAAHAPLRPPRLPRLARFQDAIRFVGLDVSSPQATDESAPLAPGETLLLTMHFEVARSLRGWQLVVELEGPAAGTAGEPLAAAFSVDDWRPGHKARKQLGITAHPRQALGAYTLHAGFRRPSSASDRLPVTPSDAHDGHDRLRVLTLTVGDAARPTAPPAEPP